MNFLGLSLALDLARLPRSQAQYELSHNADTRLLGGGLDIHAARCSFLLSSCFLSFFRGCAFLEPT